ncbi:MAG: toxin-antitoxin system antitoxin subunit [Promethearchaeota archaeon Loki_b32]|nr:MAG: toxin-antitoxin system antitoxin subunit [Candidatus Lokiarchaeota archaeon Loki_b32]
MKERTSKIYFEDIITFFKRIESYIQDLNFENFRENQLVIDAVIRNLVLIGEASKNIFSET